VAFDTSKNASVYTGFDASARGVAAGQDLLGLQSADTTRVYTKVAAQRLADIHRRAFPG
jgi:site-specific recombinase XerD